MKRRAKEEARHVRNAVYRRHILEAAERVFSERGFDNAKLQQISAHAGLSMGTIYSIFASKEDLFAALLEERGRELVEVARSVAARPGSAREALDRLIDAYVGYFVDHPTFLRMHLGLGSSWILKPRPETDAQVEIWREVHALQASVFRRGVEEGAFVDEDPAYLAKLFSAMDQVVLAEWVAGGMKDDRAALAERVRRTADRLFSR